MEQSRHEIWWHKDEPEFSLMNVISGAIANFERQYADGIPQLRESDGLVLGSDYGGSHSDAPYESLCFIVADTRSVGRWRALQGILRSGRLSDGRRLSYKGLNDRKKQEALIPFLKAANSINGLVLAVLIDKRMPSLLQPSGRLSRDDPELSSFAHWKVGSIEKMLRAVHFISLLLRGLSAPDQDVMWVTDQDAIAANEARLRELILGFSNVVSQYLPHDLGHIRVGTTMIDDGKREIEDFVAIPDLVAGALSDVIPVLIGNGVLTASRVMIPAPAQLKPKSQTIMNWFSDNSQPLKRVVLVLDESSTKQRCRVTCMRLHGSNDA